MATCKCGRRVSKHSNECRRCAAERITELRAKYSAVLATGTCPRCGRPLVRNSSIAGWWQCEQFGADTHRADPSQPACSYQFIIPEED